MEELSCYKAGSLHIISLSSSNWCLSVRMLKGPLPLLEEVYESWTWLPCIHNRDSHLCQSETEGYLRLKQKSVKTSLLMETLINQNRLCKCVIGKSCKQNLVTKDVSLAQTQLPGCLRSKVSCFNTFLRSNLDKRCFWHRHNRILWLGICCSVHKKIGFFLNQCYIIFSLVNPNHRSSVLSSLLHCLYLCY